MVREFITQFGPLLATVLVLGLVVRFLMATPARAMRKWRRRRRHQQRPLSAFPAAHLEAAWRFDSHLRDTAIARGTVSQYEIDQGIARGLVLVHAELRGRH